MIRQPDFITSEMLEEVRPGVKEKQGPAVDEVKIENYHEDLSAQVMHLGPYSEESPTIRRLHKFIEEQGYRPRGRHHEIYLSDPMRTEPERIKTIISLRIERKFCNRPRVVDIGQHIIAVVITTSYAT